MSAANKRQREHNGDGPFSAAADGKRQKEEQKPADPVYPASVEPMAHRAKAEAAMQALQQASLLPDTDPGGLRASMSALIDAADEGALSAEDVFPILLNVNKVVFNATRDGPGFDATRVRAIDDTATALLHSLSHVVDSWEAHSSAAHVFVNITTRIITRCIPRGPINRSVSECGLALMNLLSVGRDNSWPLRNRAVVDALVAVLQQPYDQMAQQTAAEALCGSTAADDPFTRDLLLWGFVPALIKCLVSSDLRAVSGDALNTLGNCCLPASAYLPEFHALVPKRVLEDELVAVLVRLVVGRPDLDSHLWLLQILCETDLVDPAAPLQCGAVQAAVGYLRKNIEDGDGTEEGIDEAVKLLACMKEAAGWAQALYACEGVAVLAAAASVAPPKRLGSIVDCLLHMAAAFHSCHTPLLQLLREGALCQLQRRCKQLAAELEEGTLEAVTDLVSVVSHQLTPELVVTALCPISQPHAICVGAFLAANAPVEHLRKWLLDVGVLGMLCESLLVDSWASMKFLCLAPRATPQWSSWRAAAWGLHALEQRLTGLKPPSAEASQNTGRAVMRLDLSDAALMGDHRWTDVKVVVEGRSFFVLRDALLAASPAFRAMLEGGFSEQGAPEIVLNDVPCDVWRVVLRFIYTGRAEPQPELVHQVLPVAEQYLLDGLKEQCQEVLVKQLSVANLPAMLALATQFAAKSLQQRCVAMALDHWGTGGVFVGSAQHSTDHGHAQPCGAASPARVHPRQQDPAPHAPGHGAGAPRGAAVPTSGGDAVGGLQAPDTSGGHLGNGGAGAGAEAEGSAAAARGTAVAAEFDRGHTSVGGGGPAVDVVVRGAYAACRAGVFCARAETTGVIVTARQLAAAGICFDDEPAAADTGGARCTRPGSEAGAVGGGVAGGRSPGAGSVAVPTDELGLGRSAGGELYAQQACTPAAVGDHELQEGAPGRDTDGRAGCSPPPRAPQHPGTTAGGGGGGHEQRPADAAGEGLCERHGGVYADEEVPGVAAAGAGSDVEMHADAEALGAAVAAAGAGCDVELRDDAGGSLALGPPGNEQPSSGGATADHQPAATAAGEPPGMAAAAGVAQMGLMDRAPEPAGAVGATERAPEPADAVGATDRAPEPAGAVGATDGAPEPAGAVGTTGAEGPADTVAGDDSALDLLDDCWRQAGGPPSSLQNGERWPQPGEANSVERTLADRHQTNGSPLASPGKVAHAGAAAGAGTGQAASPQCLDPAHPTQAAAADMPAAAAVAAADAAAQMRAGIQEILDEDVGDCPCVRQRREAYADDALRAQVAALLLPWLKQLLDEVLPGSTPAAHGTPDQMLEG